VAIVSSESFADIWRAGIVGQSGSSQLQISMKNSARIWRWRFGVAVMRSSWSTQLLYIEPGYYWGWWLPSGRYTISLRNQPPRPTEPGHPSVGRCNEYWRWLRPPLGKKTASSA